MAQPEVVNNPATALEQIGNQKWAALFLQGTEACSEWRRTGYPAFSPAVDALNDSKQIPVRQAYPTPERDLNSTNYEMAISRQGEDNLDTRLWWDVV